MFNLNHYIFGHMSNIQILMTMIIKIDLDKIGIGSNNMVVNLIIMKTSLPKPFHHPFTDLHGYEKAN
jgi:hypothetical protein